MGAPVGNKFAANALVAKKALEYAIGVRSGQIEPRETIERFSILVEMWNKQIDKALEGDNDSFKHLVERMDGKSPQAVNIGGQPGNPVRGEWTVLPVAVDAANQDR